MATYYTKAEARSFASTKIQKSATRDSRRILREEVRAATNEDRFDIFLSHASADGDLILGVKSLLESFGFKVYVDWVDDPQLDRSKVSKESADLLRRRMRQSKSLVWAATEAASDSKWMPWELGYFDGFKPNQVAVLPLVDNSSDTFRGQEYLNLVSDWAHRLDGGERRRPSTQAGGVQRCGSSSSMRWLGCSSKRSSTSLR